MVSKVPSPTTTAIVPAYGSSRTRKVGIWPLGSSSMYRLASSELERQLRKMKQGQVVTICLDMATQLRYMEKQLLQRPLDKINEEDEDEGSEEIDEESRTRCRFSVSGCPFKLASMEMHEDKECKYRPTRCPSLTCPEKPPFIKLLKHIEVHPKLSHLI